MPGLETRDVPTVRRRGQAAGDAMALPAGCSIRHCTILNRACKIPGLIYDRIRLSENEKGKVRLEVGVRPRPPPAAGGAKTPLRTM